MEFHNGQRFTTYDMDQDLASRNCAVNREGGWWFGACGYANLNGKYGLTVGKECVRWALFRYPKLDCMKRTEMMVRCEG